MVLGFIHILIFPGIQGVIYCHKIHCLEGVPRSAVVFYIDFPESTGNTFAYSSLHFRNQPLQTLTVASYFRDSVEYT